MVGEVDTHEHGGEAVLHLRGLQVTGVLEKFHHILSDWDEASIIGQFLHNYEDNKITV